MTDKKQKNFKSWLIVYAAMFAAVIFAAQSSAVASRDQGALSPVVIGGKAPILDIVSVTRRSDL